MTGRHKPHFDIIFNSLANQTCIAPTSVPLFLPPPFLQGFLNRMDDQVTSLREEVRLKDALIEQLTSSVADLTTKLAKMEKASSISSHRMGQCSDDVSLDPRCSVITEHL